MNEQSNERLSAHFTLGEFTRSATAERLALDNHPPGRIIERLKILCVLLERIRFAVGGPIIITSGYRSEAVNRAVGGSPSSSHLSGFAADIRHGGLVASSRLYDEIARLRGEHELTYDQLIYYPKRGHVHVSADPRNRGQAWMDRT